MTPTQEQRSLFGEILDWMLAPLLLLWPMSLGLTSLLAQEIASRPYDREIGEAARLLSTQVVIEAAARPGDLPRVHIRAQDALALLRSDDVDRVYHQVLGTRGELVSGERDLQVPEDAFLPTPGVRFRDDMMRDEPVRVAYLFLPLTQEQGGRGVLVQFAETLDKRSRLTTEIIKGLILPQFLVLPLAVLLVWLALARGIRPLNELQQRIRLRDSGDLSPIDERSAPAEVAPLVASINDLLARLGQSIDTQKHFLADAAHQLKTPLAGLRMQAELAEREIDAGQSDPRALKASLQQIALSSERAAHAVNQLLAMARAEDREQALRTQPVDLAAITQDAVRDLVPKAVGKQIDIGYEGSEPDGSAFMVGLPVLLGELARNLLDNAIKYTPAGGTVTARVLSDPFGQVLVLQVEDSGPGIPAAERELVFQPFYRTLGTGIDGTGLGLAIVLEIARQHRAEVSIEDTHPRPNAAGAGPGTRLTVRFPLEAGRLRSA